MVIKTVNRIREALCSPRQKKYFSQSGVSLIEVIVGVAIFVVVAMGIYNAYESVQGIIRVSRQKITAVALANEQLEIARNMPYEDVGIEDGIPSGKIPREQLLERAGTEFSVVTTVRNIDDPFDGTIDGDPTDTTPADYKMVQLDIECPDCSHFRPFSITTRVAPRNLEATSDAGALFIEVLDAEGLPIQGANVHVENNEEVPAIVIDDTTNNNGLLKLIGVPPGVEDYEISATKDDYSSSRTYGEDELSPSSPVKSHSTVVEQMLTEITFEIDKLSSIEVASVTDSCASLGNIGFALAGAKKIGKDPNVLKYEEEHNTAANGFVLINQLEWDNYTITTADSAPTLVTSLPDTPLILSPDSERKATLVFEEGIDQPPSLLVDVKNAATGEYVENAEVTLEGNDPPETLFTENPDCVPPGYVWFSDLEENQYELTVTAEGYENFNESLNVLESWQEKEVTLIPQ